MLIFKVVLEDLGNYRVEVINFVGIIVKVFIVKVNGRFCWFKKV